MDFYVFRDFRNLLYLCLVVIFCRGDEPIFGPKTLYRILLAFILFTASHAAVIADQIPRRRIPPHFLE